MPWNFRPDRKADNLPAIVSPAWSSKESDLSVTHPSHSMRRLTFMIWDLFNPLFHAEYFKPTLDWWVLHSVHHGKLKTRLCRIHHCKNRGLPKCIIQIPPPSLPALMQAFANMLCASLYMLVLQSLLPTWLHVWDGKDPTAYHPVCVQTDPLTFIQNGSKKLESKLTRFNSFLSFVWLELKNSFI